MKRFLRRAAALLLTFALFVVLAIFIWPEAKPVAYVADDAYRAQALAYPVPDLPADWTTRKIAMADGTKIHVGQSGNRETAKATLLFVPGYTSAIDFYGDQYDMLTARGFHLVAMDLRGQGRSGRHRESHPQKMYVKDFSVYGDDIAQVITALDLAGGKPLVLMGMSLGGAAVTRAAQDHDTGAEALLLLAPAYRPFTPPYDFEQGKRIVALGRMFGKSERYLAGQTDWVPDGLDMTVPTDCGRYPPRLYTRDAMYMREPSLMVGGMTFSLLGEMLENGEIVTQPDRLAAMDMPVTIVLPERDVIVDSTIAEAACNGMADCKATEIPESGHCLTLENDDVLNAMWDEAEGLLGR